MLDNAEHKTTEGMLHGELTKKDNNNNEKCRIESELKGHKKGLREKRYCGLCICTAIVDRATSPLLTRRSNLRSARRGRWKAMRHCVSVNTRYSGGINQLTVYLTAHEPFQLVHTSVLVVVNPSRDTKEVIPSTSNTK